jgi:hypothetical protein
MDVVDGLHILASVPREICQKAFKDIQKLKPVLNLK